MAKVREAIKILQEALPELQPGSEQHKAVLNSISSISKFVPASAEVPGVQQTALRDLQQNAGKNAMLQQVMSSLGSAGSAGSAGGAGMPQAAGAPQAPMGA